MTGTGRQKGESSRRRPIVVTTWGPSGGIRDWKVMALETKGHEEFGNYSSS